ncbi:tRNA guanosine(34) transglycosylase Tgt [Coprothermobacteraceae bacterium]|nr:tRNA guanosine(34) transglycosylase Tgt [Coprothermobacteraceae bacterium]
MFDVIKDTKVGRLGVLTLGHAVVETPVYMPVATRAAIRVATLDRLEELGYRLILNNTYHLVLRPGLDVIAEYGGTHSFMAWNHAVLTDSGGFQVYSLSHGVKVREEGVEFRSPIDGSKHFFTPEFVAEAQRIIGSDIVMQLDVCLGYPTQRKHAKLAMERTLRWGERFLSVPLRPYQRRFGIVQGGFEKDLRRKSAELTAQLPFDGFALGGFSVGEPEELMFDLAAEVLAILPTDKPRYMMGLGHPAQLVEFAAMGVDMFDCVQPTRHARHGWVYTPEGPYVIVRPKFKMDRRPLHFQPQYTYGYLHHLFRAGEPLAMVIATVENLSYMADLMYKVRNAIGSGNLESLKQEVKYQWAKKV